MLCISRLKGQFVRIGPDIWVGVADIDRGKIRLVIDAPKEIQIAREELLPVQERRKKGTANAPSR